MVSAEPTNHLISVSLFVFSEACADTFSLSSTGETGAILKSATFNMYSGRK